MADWQQPLTAARRPTPRSPEGRARVAAEALPTRATPPSGKGTELAAADQGCHQAGRGFGEALARGELSWKQVATFCELTAVAAVLITVAVSLAAVAISQW